MSNTSNTALEQWNKEVAELTKPDRIVWCNGSQDEYQGLVDEMLANGTLSKLNQDDYPNCYLHRSDPRQT